MRRQLRYFHNRAHDGPDTFLRSLLALGDKRASDLHAFGTQLGPSYGVREAPRPVIPRVPISGSAIRSGIRGGETGRGHEFQDPWNAFEPTSSRFSAREPSSSRYSALDSVSSRYSSTLPWRSESTRRSDTSDRARAPRIQYAGAEYADLTKGDEAPAQALPAFGYERRNEDVFEKERRNVRSEVPRARRSEVPVDFDLENVPADPAPRRSERALEGERRWGSGKSDEIQKKIDDARKYLEAQRNEARALAQRPPPAEIEGRRPAQEKNAASAGGIGRQDKGLEEKGRPVQDKGLEEKGRQEKALEERNAVNAIGMGRQDKGLEEKGRLAQELQQKAPRAGEMRKPAEEKVETERVLSGAEKRKPVEDLLKKGDEEFDVQENVDVGDQGTLSDLEPAADKGAQPVKAEATAEAPKIKPLEQSEGDVSLGLAGLDSGSDSDATEPVKQKLWAAKKVDELKQEPASPKYPQPPAVMPAPPSTPPPPLSSSDDEAPPPQPRPSPPAVMPAPPSTPPPPLSSSDEEEAPPPRPSPPRGEFNFDFDKPVRGMACSSLDKMPTLRKPDFLTPTQAKPPTSPVMPPAVPPPPPPGPPPDLDYSDEEEPQTKPAPIPEPEPKIEPTPEPKPEPKIEPEPEPEPEPVAPRGLVQLTPLMARKEFLPPSAIKAQILAVVDLSDKLFDDSISSVVGLM